MAAALLWLPQAAIVAWLLALLLEGAGTIASSLGAAAGFLALGMIRAMLQHWSDRVAVIAADDVLSRERRTLVTREGRRSPMVAGAGSAEIAALAGTKIASLQPYLTRYRPAYLRAMVIPPVILAIALWHSWAVALVLLVAGPLIPVFMALVGMAAQQASERQMDEIGSLNALLMERLQALVDIRLLDAGERVAEEFDVRADGLRERTMSVLRVAFLSSTVLELFSAIGVAMVAVFVGFSLLGQIGFGVWATPLTSNEGVFLLLLTPDFFQPLRDVAAAWHDKAAASAVARDLVQIEADAPVTLVGHGAAVPPLLGPAGIAAKGLAVCIAPDVELAFPDFTLAPAQSCALVGPSGRGKTTLLAALAGLLPVSRGELLVAGQVLDAQTADAWRMRIGWVPQAPHFFAASLRANLRLASPGASDAQIAEALAVTEAEGVVARLPRGLLTRLGETGTGVSGGEARRLMVARAALGEADVILADEPTANLDAVTAQAVTEGLLRLARGGATLIVATHDLELAARMDRQITLEEPS